jgi:hypothetical protein
MEEEKKYFIQKTVGEALRLKKKKEAIPQAG